jgi:hypothetical protein
MAIRTVSADVIVDESTTVQDPLLCHLFRVIVDDLQVSPIMRLMTDAADERCYRKPRGKWGRGYRLVGSARLLHRTGRKRDRRALHDDCWSGRVD